MWNHLNAAGKGGEAGGVFHPRRAAGRAVRPVAQGAWINGANERATTIGDKTNASSLGEFAEHFGADHRGSVRRRGPFGRLEYRVAAANLAPRHRARAGRMRGSAPPPLLAIMTSPRFDPTDHHRRVGALENLDAYAIGTVKGDGLQGHHHRLRI